MWVGNFENYLFLMSENCFAGRGILVFDVGKLLCGSVILKIIFCFWVVGRREVHTSGARCDDNSECGPLALMLLLLLLLFFLFLPVKTLVKKNERDKHTLAYNNNDNNNNNNDNDKNT